MICVNTRYFSLHRILLLMIGLWPYEQSKLTRLQLILFNSILMSFILVQFATFMTRDCTLQFVIEVLSVAFLFITYVIKYMSYCINLETIKDLLGLLQRIYDELHDEGEIAIMDQYGNMARYHTGILALMSTFGASLFTLSPFWARMIDIVWPANESRPDSRLYIPTEYFIDQKRYFYLIVLHSNAAFYVGSTAMVAIGTTSMSYFIHICGMFKVASYRMEQAMMICTLEVSSARYQNILHKGIICAIDMHRKAIRGVTFLFRVTQLFISKLQIFFFLLFACVVIATSLNLFRIITSGLDYDELIIPLICLNTINFFMVISNNNAQQVMDHNEDLFTTVYNVKWYNAPLRIQKIILFMLQRGTKPFYVTLGGVFVASLESAAKLLSASMSYFTVLYSTRQDI